MSSTGSDLRLLLLLRHGKAEDGFGRSDKSRELTSRGRAQARFIGQHLESQGVRPTRVLVSDAVRTRQTWDEALAAMPGFDGKATFHDEIYSAGVSGVLELIRSRKDKHNVVMVVGHEPTLGMLASLFAGDGSDAAAEAQARVGLPTGSMAVLSAPLAHWGQSHERMMALHSIVRSND